MTPLISVLMSVYNESEQYIRESVLSMLNQTFKDFELIVINDNPQRNDVKVILDSYIDDRIIYCQNNQNIGLAMSMNKAANIARADVFARMDADDIGVCDRLEKQYRVLTTGRYDFVFSCYDYIDVNSRPLEGRDGCTFYESNNLNKKIQLKPFLIHHPTVMFTRRIFEKVSGYRDFPCAQDGDLWMRMAEQGCRFLMLKDCLLHYRINPSSVTYSKCFLQKITTYYSFQLSCERLARGNDSYSKEHYQRYLEKFGLGSSNKEVDFKKQFNKLQRVKQTECYSFIIVFYSRFSAVLSSKLLRQYLWNKVWKKCKLDF